MTSIDRTIYRRMKRSYTTKELIEAYTPTLEEHRFVSTMTRTVQNQLNLMLWIKLFPCLGYFPALSEIPVSCFCSFSLCLIFTRISALASEATGSGSPRHLSPVSRNTL